MNGFLIAHVATGCTAFAAMIVAFAVTKGSRPHRLAGKTYVVSMAVSLVMSLIVAVQIADLFIALIAFFSAYLVYTGWRIAYWRTPEATLADRIAVRSMLIAGIAMIGYGIWMLTQREDMGVVLVVFGAVALVFGWLDLPRLKGWPTGKDRILMHVSRMGAASIATVTAPTVVNIRTEPEFIAWLAPGVLMTPVIIYWERRVRQGKMSFLDRA